MHSLLSKSGAYHHGISSSRRPPLARLIMTALLSSILTVSSLGVAHPHSFYEATDEAISRPLDLSNVRLPPIHNARLRYRLILTESQAFPGYEEFYVCLRDPPPDSQQLLAHCVSAFSTTAHQAEDQPAHEDMQPLLLPKDMLRHQLSTSAMHDLVNMTGTSPGQPATFEVPYGMYYEQERTIKYDAYPYASPDLIDDLKLAPQRRFGFQPLGDPIHIAAILYNWLIFERSYLPVRIPILLPTLAEFLRAAGLSSTGEDSLLYHCLITFEPRRWQPDQIRKSCLPSVKSWHNPAETVYSSEIINYDDKSTIISLDHLAP